MSLNIHALEPVKIEPASLDITPKPYAVDTGYANRTFRSYAPSGSAGDYSSGVNWSLSIPSGVGVSRRGYMSATFELTIDFSNTNAATIVPFGEDAYAPRAYPLNRSIATQTATLDSVRFTQNNAQIMDVVNHCLDDEVHKVNCLNSVYRRDNCPSYSMMNAASNNPLRSYSDGMYQSPGRGVGYFYLENTPDNTPVPAYTAAGPGTAQRTVRFTVAECIMVPPFHYETKQEQPALFGLETLELDVNFANLRNTLWSQYVPQGASVSVSDVKVMNPRLMLEMLTPKVGFTLPKQVSYDVFEMTQYVQAHGAAISSGATATLVNNNNKLSNSVPSRIFVFARRSPNTLPTDKGNTFLGIQSLSVQMNNRSGLLADASREQLWDLSRTNGLEQEYEEWVMRKFGDKVLSGGLICLDPAKDLSLDVDYTNGSNGSNEISITAYVQNNDLEDYPAGGVELVIVGLYEGVLNLIEGTKYEYSYGVISRADVLSAQKLPTVYESQISGLHGGKRRHLGRKIRHALRKVADYVKSGKAKKLLSTIGDVVYTGTQVAKLAGMGKGKKGRGMTAAGMTAAGLTGGKSLSRNQLLAIMNY